MNATKEIYIIYDTDTDFRTYQVFDWGEQRIIPNDGEKVKQWLSEGNTIEKRSGSKYITIVGDKVSFNSVAYNAYIVAQKKENLALEYEPKFNELARAFLNASMLNDSITLAETRIEYQSLLTEYNNRLVAIA